MGKISNLNKIIKKNLFLKLSNKLGITLLVTVSATIILGSVINSSNSLISLAFLWLGVIIAWTASWGGRKIGLINSTLCSVYLCYTSFYKLPGESTLDQVIVTILGVISLLMIACLSSRQQEISWELDQQLEIANEELADKARENADLLAVANEFINQEIGDRLVAESELQASQTRLNLLMEALPIMIFYVDSQQRYRCGNQQYEQLFNSSSNLEGQHLQEVIGNANYRQIKGAVEATLLGKRVIDQQMLTAKHGKMIELHLSLIPHFGSSMEVIGFFTLAQDLTEYKLSQMN